MIIQTHDNNASGIPLYYRSLVTYFSFREMFFQTIEVITSETPCKLWLLGDRPGRVGGGKAGKGETLDKINFGG
jgi:hypothetical protein